MQIGPSRAAARAAQADPQADSGVALAETRYQVGRVDQAGACSGGKPRLKPSWHARVHPACVLRLAPGHTGSRDAFRAAASSMEIPTSGLPRGEHQRNARAQRLGQRQTLCNRLPASSEPSVAITTFLYMAQVLETLHYEPALPFVGVRRAKGAAKVPPCLCVAAVDLSRRRRYLHCGIPR